MCAHLLNQTMKRVHRRGFKVVSIPSTYVSRRYIPVMGSYAVLLLSLYGGREEPMMTSHHLHQHHVITAPSVQELDQSVQEDVFITAFSRPPQSERLFLSITYYSSLCTLYYSCSDPVLVNTSPFARVFSSLMLIGSEWATSEW